MPGSLSEDVENGGSVLQGVAGIEAFQDLATLLEHRTHYRNHPDAADLLIHAGEAPVADIDPRVFGRFGASKGPAEVAAA